MYLRDKVSVRGCSDVPYCVIQDNLTKREAFDLEKSLIRAIGVLPFGPLTNKVATQQEAGLASHAQKDVRGKSIHAVKMGYKSNDQKLPDGRSMNAVSRGLASHSKKDSD